MKNKFKLLITYAFLLLISFIGGCAPNIIKYLSHIFPELQTLITIYIIWGVIVQALVFIIARKTNLALSKRNRLCVDIIFIFISCIIYVIGMVVSYVFVFSLVMSYF